MTNVPSLRHLMRASALALLAGACLILGSGKADVQAQNMTLDICPINYGSFPENAPPLTCGCAPDAAKSGTVRGANPYYYQSSLCRAALHAGAIGPEGGQIVVVPEKATVFPAVERNGVTADSWGEGMGFRVEVAARSTAPRQASGVGVTPTAPPAQSPAMALDVCPTNYGSFSETAAPLTCGCDANAVKTGNVRGANPYYYQSSLCRSALHAGAIGPDGGQIIVRPRPASVFPATARNGVLADSWGKGMGFSVSPTAGGRAGASAPFDAEANAGSMLDICPIHYGGFPEDAPPLTCGCDAAAAKAGTVRGANPYYYQSSPCRSALHAGAIGIQGGQIIVKPEKAAVFPAVTRNGVAGASWGQGMGFRVAAVAPSVDRAGRPIQAPIAATLRATGRVQLYINFATDQDKPLASSESILQELLATLQADRALRILLVGHTDNQGPGAHNLDLSQRRAAAVYLWLIQRGVDSGRLNSDGRGLMEPIADNATDTGRALNRRVEAKAVN